MHSHNDTNLQPSASVNETFDALGDALGADSFHVAVCGCASALFHFVPGRGLFCADCLTQFIQQ